jgi:hypothetical protein
MIQLDPSGILRNRFLNYVVVGPGLGPLLFHIGFHDAFVQVNHSVFTRRAVEESLETWIVVAGDVADNGFCRQAGLHLMRESAHDPRTKGSIIVPCAKYILRLVLPKSIQGNDEFATHIRSMRRFQGIV